MELMPRRPGTSSVRANLQHQVPGGPRKVWQGPDIPVTTPKPRLKVEFVSAPVHDNVMDFARLSPGDRHIITVEAVGVGKRIGELGPMWGTSATSGVVSLTPTRSLGPTKQEYAVVGNKAGPFDYTISWQIPNTDMLPVESGGVHGSVMMDRQEFINRCTTAHQIVDGKYDLIGAFTKELSIMYGHAWKMHTGALKGANARRRLIGELIMFGALAFVTGGVGGAVGKYVSSRFAKDSYGGVIAGDAFKDLWKDTSRRLGAAGIQGQAGPPALEAFPEDPTVWQNKEEAAILREAGQMKLLISDWSDGASKSRQFPTDFDPVDTINDKLRVAGVKPEQLGSPNELEALRFEKGFWKEWLGKYAYELKLPMGCSPLLRLESNLDKPIEERIEACAKGLGEDGEAWIDAWASPLKRELERRRGY
jgi:hypothetical protein